MEASSTLVPVTENQLQVLLESAYAWLKLGRADMAEQVLDGISTLAPRWHAPWLARGLIAQLKRDFRSALQMFRTAERLSAKRNGDLIHLHLAEVLLCLQKPAEAKGELRKAIQADPSGVAGKWCALRLEALGTKAPGGVNP
jgi:Tfp pilus assembly protein PilF